VRYNKCVPESDATVPDASWRSLVRDGYDAISAAYTDLANSVDDTHPRKQQTAALLERLRPNSTLLELGCGGGLPVAATVVAAGHRLVGVDLSSKQIDLATRNVPGGEFLVGDIAEQDFAPATFDAVLLLYVITHVPKEEWAAVLHNIRRWLTPGGWLLLNVPHHASPGWREEDFLGLGTTNWTNSFDSPTSLALLTEKGFTIIDTQTLGEDEHDPEGWLWVLARTPQ
jgi:SAM-dependent methyltransferase